MKKALLTVLLFIIVLMLAGCFSLNTGAPGNNAAAEKLNIYGDDLAIAAQDDNYRGSTSSTTAGSQTAFEYSGFDGSMTRLQFVAGGEGQVEISYDATVAKGRFKMVLVPEDGKVTVVFEGSGKGTKSFDLPAGITRVKFVGDTATGRFQVTLDPSENVVVESLKVNTQPIHAK